MVCMSLAGIMVISRCFEACLISEAPHGIISNCTPLYFVNRLGASVGWSRAGSKSS